MDIPQGPGVLDWRKTDKYQLYQWAVQDPEEEVVFLKGVYRDRHGRDGPKPRGLREDFCGTALISCAWVRSDPERWAIALDRDQAPLDWAMAHNVPLLGARKGALDPRQGDVRQVTQPKADLICALNFSCFLLSGFQELTGYLEKARLSLAPGGLVVMDCYGGWESQQAGVEQRVVRTPEGVFTYIWDQTSFNPIDNMAECHIHFRFGDGTNWEKAFTYRWRIYSPAELCDALDLAGFTYRKVYWDCEEDEGHSRYLPRWEAQNQPGWLAYVVAGA